MNNNTNCAKISTQSKILINSTGLCGGLVFLTLWNLIVIFSIKNFEA